MTWRTVWRAGAALSAVLAVGAAAVTVPGSISFEDRPDVRTGWAAVCHEHQPRADRVVLHRCARVTGRVLRVERRSTSTGPEVHLLVVASLHTFLVKLDVPSRGPDVGSWVTAVGALVRSRVGLREVQAWDIR